VPAVREDGVESLLRGGAEQRLLVRVVQRVVDQRLADRVDRESVLVAVRRQERTPGESEARPAVPTVWRAVRRSMGMAAVLVALCL